MVYYYYYLDSKLLSVWVKLLKASAGLFEIIYFNWKLWMSQSDFKVWQWHLEISGEWVHEIWLSGSIISWKLDLRQVE